jgi:hypothetical protein
MIDIEITDGSYFLIELDVDYAVDKAPVSNKTPKGHGRRGAANANSNGGTLNCIGCVLRIQWSWDLWIKTLRHDHLEWSTRNSDYDSEWGSPRNDVTERNATIAHEWDHTRAYWDGMWSGLTSEIAPFMERAYSSRQQCLKAANCLGPKIEELYGIARIHTEKFDDDPGWRYGGAYSAHPLDLSNWSVDECEQYK